MSVYRASKGVKQKSGKVWDPTLKSKNSVTTSRTSAKKAKVKEPELVRAHREEWRKEGKDGLHS
jgi:hypothetical protein